MSLPQDSSPAETARQIMDLVASEKSLDPATVTPESNFDDLGIDSLDKINLTFKIEDLYKIEIPDDSLNSLRTVGDVIAGVLRLRAEQHSAA